MSEFVRKIRKINYYHDKCKKYLRYDFGYRCAYCGLHEFESILAYNSFQIDHFRPKKMFAELPEIDDYPNLFYCCSICNSRSGKSDRWDENLLNPCMVKIVGDDHHVKSKPDLKTFKLIPNTEQGKLFIDVIKLDQKKQREIRRERYARNVSLDKKKAKLEEMISDALLTPESEEKRKLLSYLQNEYSELDCEYLGPYHKAQLLDEDELVFFKAVHQIDSQIKITQIYDEKELDTLLQYAEFSTKCYVEYTNKLKFRKGQKVITVNEDLINDWRSISDRIICLLVDTETKLIYYASLPDAGNKIIFEEVTTLTKYSFPLIFGEDANFSNLQAAPALSPKNTGE